MICASAGTCSPERIHMTSSSTIRSCGTSTSRPSRRTRKSDATRIESLSKVRLARSSVTMPIPVLMMMTKPNTASRQDPVTSTSTMAARMMPLNRVKTLARMISANERDVESLTLLVRPDSTRASTSARLRPRSAVAGMEGASLGVLMSSFAFRAYNGHYPLLAAAVRRWYISTLILP